MNKNICCIGAGYIGGPTMAVIAKMNPNRKVTVVDINEKRIADWNSDDFALPIYEPGLIDVVKEVRGKNLFFSTDIESAVIENDIIFVGVNTPTKMFGRGKGEASDLQFWEATARNIAKFAKGNKIVVEKSTLPVKTASSMEAILNASSAYKFTVLSNPEFLAEGTAVEDLKNPDRVLIGGSNSALGRAAVNEIVEIYRGENGAWVSEDKILTTNVWSAELTKLAANAMLAQRVSSVNALTELCEATGADISEISRVIGADSRIGSKFLKAGPGFGGSCFKKDILNLVYLCESFGLYDAAEYWSQVVKMNTHQQERIVARLFKEMFNSLANKKIVLLGFAFKANTGDTRETPAGVVARLLKEENVRLTIVDPQALENAKKDLSDLSGIEYEKDPYIAANGADAILLMTDWQEYFSLDWKRIYDAMQKPSFVFDTRNCLDSQNLSSIGFKVLNIGKVND